MQYNNKISKSQEPARTLVNGTYHKTGFCIQVHENSVSFWNDRDRRPKKDKVYYRRDCVKNFSDKSRLRIKKLFARVRISSYKEIVFLTLTWHYAYKSLGGDYYSKLNLFLQYLRDNIPDIDYVWRLEFQKRGAPHFHLIVLFKKKQGKKGVARFTKICTQAWHRIADPDSVRHKDYGCLVAIAENYKQAFAYVSKYCAKESEVHEEEYTGRRWGRSRTLDLSPVFELNVPYAFYKFARQVIYRMFSEVKYISPEFLDIINGDGTLFCYFSLDKFRLICNQYLSSFLLNGSVELCNDKFIVSLLEVDGVVLD